MGRGRPIGPTPTSRSGRVIVVLLLLAVVVIFSLARKNRNRTKAVPSPQTSDLTGTSAFDIAKEALDRSVDTLTNDPGWREGCQDVVFENGTYDVAIIDASDDANGVFDTRVPKDCIRIVATGRTAEDTVSVEGIWVNAAAAFSYVLSAGNEISFDEYDDGSSTVIGDLHDNAWENGAVDIGGGNTIFGNVTSAGRISLGNSASLSAAVVHGRIWGNEVVVHDTGEIRDFERLDEQEEGFDLDLDGERDNLVVSRCSGRLSAARAASSGGQRLSDGGTDLRVCDGMRPVTVGGPKPGTIADPRPDFAAYYELVTGALTYPPRGEHVSTPINGDGDGHYFASTHHFTNWLHTHYPASVACCRCGGDGRVDPDDTTFCPGCDATGSDAAIEVAGVFYIDDELVDLSGLGANLIVHGTIVVANGNPRQWPRKSVNVPGGTVTLDHFPREGRIVIKGPTRMHFTQTHRSSTEGAAYGRHRRSVRAGSDEQTIPVPGPRPEHAMTNFPALLAASQIVIEPRSTGFAYYRADIGDEKMTILQGVIFAEELVRLDARGGWNGEPIVFEEEMSRADDDLFDEAVLNIDLNGDGDLFDNVKMIDITTRPVVPVSKQQSNVDINNDGIFSSVVIGSGYRQFFSENDFALPILIYHEGMLVGQTLHVGGQSAIVFDPRTAESGLPFGFDVQPTAVQRGLLTWREIPPR